MEYNIISVVYNKEMIFMNNRQNRNGIIFLPKELSNRINELAYKYHLSPQDYCIMLLYRSITWNKLTIINNSFEKWTKTEYSTLTELWLSGKSINYISNKINRTQKSIWYKLFHSGYIPDSEYYNDKSCNLTFDKFKEDK